MKVGQLRDLILERTEIELAISVQFRHVFLLKRNWKLVKKFGSCPPSPIAFSLDLLDLEPWIGHTDKKWKKSGAYLRSFSLRGKNLDFFRRYKLSSMRLTHHFFNLTKLGWLIVILYVKCSNLLYKMSKPVVNFWIEKIICQS